jgi:hypothetical protein
VGTPDKTTFVPSAVKLIEKVNKLLAIIKNVNNKQLKDGDKPKG